MVSSLSGEVLIKLLRFLEQEGGSLGIHRSIERPVQDGQGNRSIASAGWTIGLEFGSEEPDNPYNDMVGGASYAAETDLLVALTKVAQEVRAE